MPTVNTATLLETIHDFYGFPSGHFQTGQDIPLFMQILQTSFNLHLRDTIPEPG